MTCLKIKQIKATAQYRTFSPGTGPNLLHG
jgi:hypothetical protein